MPNDTFEPIAIIGSGCRLPGGVSSPSQLWDLLQDPQSRQVASKPPADRFNIDGFYRPGDRTRYGTTRTKEAYFLQDDIRRFDAPFFNISPVEAASIDPQQRLLLETVYESLDRAGLRLEDLQGSSTGVFCSSVKTDYNQLLGVDSLNFPPFNITGTAISVVANRLSYFFDWHGPSMTLDTACSGSLVALHLACNALQSGECPLAVVAGSSLTLSPDTLIAESQMKMLSPTSRGRMWDEKADGYGRGEGVASVVLKRFSDALRDGDTIDCVVRATGVNSDGRSKGLTMPNSDAQMNLIRATYARAGLDPRNPVDRCQYFEAHGSGTPAGDPQEAAAISRAFYGDGSTADQDDILHVGTIKTVVGHSEAASGLAGIIKCSLAMRNGAIPPNLLFDRINPEVAPFTTHLRVPTQLTPWPTIPEGNPRRVSINAFGIGGTNSHVILESFDHEPNAEYPETQVVLPFVFSAQSETSLRAMQRKYAEFLAENPNTDLLDLAATLMTRRSTFAYRAVLTATTSSDLREQLHADDAPVLVQRQRSGDSQQILGVFTGQGAQWPQMGLDLITECPAAAKWLDELQQSLDSLPAEYRPQFTLLEKLSAPETANTSPGLNTAIVSMPLRTALQIIQVNILRTLGIRFAAVVGHSSGEIAAAYAAGWLSASAAIRIAYLRGLMVHEHVCNQRSGEGGMLSVGLSWDQAQALCDEPPYAGRVTVAAWNSPTSVTLSGDVEMLQELEWLFSSLGHRSHRLRVDTAFHSHYMTPCAEPYWKLLEACQVEAQPSSSPDTKWVSSVYDEPSVISSPPTAKYWAENLLRPVHFAQALSTAVAEMGDLNVVVEVGPHAALQGPSLQTLSDIRPDNALDIPYIKLAQRGQPGLAVLSQAIGAFWAYLPSGQNVGDSVGMDIQRYVQLFQPSREKLARLNRQIPTYPFDHSQSYWAVSRLATDHMQRRHALNPLLGVITPETGAGEWRWRNYLRWQELEWLDDHRVQSQPVFPATGYLSMALEAANIIADGQKSVRLLDAHDLVIDREIPIPDHGVETLVTFTQERIAQDDSDQGAHNILSGPFVCQAYIDGVWQRCAAGHIQITLGDQDETLLPERIPESSEMADVDTEELYHKQEALGYAYTGSIRVLTDLKRQHDRASGMIDPVVKSSQDPSLLLHPAILVSGLQAFLAIVNAPGNGGISCLPPVRIEHATINPTLCCPNGTRGPLVVDAALVKMDQTGICGDVDIFDSYQGHQVVQIEGVHLNTPSPKEEDVSTPLFSTTVWGPWQPDASLAAPINLDTDESKSRRLSINRLSLLSLRDIHGQLIVKDGYQVLDGQRACFADWMNRTLTKVREGTHPIYPAEWLEQSSEDIVLPEMVELSVIDDAAKSLKRWLVQPDPDMEKSTLAERMVMLHRFSKVSRDLRTMRGALAALVGQLVFRFPHMRILEVGTGADDATRSILQSIGQRYYSYTYANCSGDYDSSFIPPKDDIIHQVLDLEQDPVSQGLQEGGHDLIIAADLACFADLRSKVARLRRLLKPGGRLVALFPTQPVSISLPLVYGAFGHCGDFLDVSGWDQLLKEADFGGLETISPTDEAQNAELAIFTAQALDDHVRRIQHPLADVPQGQHLNGLVLIGGKTPVTQRLIDSLRELLGPYFQWVRHGPTFDTMDSLPEESVPAAALVLSGLDFNQQDQEIISSGQFHSLRDLTRVAGKLLWVAPEAKRRADSHLLVNQGLLKAARSEAHRAKTFIQSLTIRDDPKTLTSELLATTFMRLMHTTTANDYTLATCVDSTEPHLMLENGIVKVPRITGSDSMNQRLLASRGACVYNQFDPQESRIQVRPDTTLSVSEQIPPVSSQSMVNICVRYATSVSLRISDTACLYLVLGHDLSMTQTRAVALSPDLASVVCTRRAWCWEVPADISEAKEPGYLRDIAASIVAAYLVNRVSCRDGCIPKVLVHEAEDSVQRAITAIASNRNIATQFSTSQKISSDGSPDKLFIHPHSPTRRIARAVPASISLMASFAKDDMVSKRLQSLLPAGVPAYSSKDLYQTSSHFVGDVQQVHAVANALDTAALLVAQNPCQSELADPVKIISANKIEDATGGIAIVDWIHSGPVEAQTAPASSLLTLSPHKAYLLVDMPECLEQQVCHWMVTRGARHVILAGQSHADEREWLEKVSQLGAKVTTLSMDVTDRNSIKRVDDTIRQDLQISSVGGIIHGSAIQMFHEGPLADMSAEILHSSLGPAVDGSAMLDEFYRQEDLDFFVLLGSISGLLGQVDQAVPSIAAEMMSCLVQERRQRGKDCNNVGSIIYLDPLRTSEDSASPTQSDSSRGTFGSLSGKDIEELFAEAILAGRPALGRPFGIIGGTRRTQPTDDVWWRDNPQMWPFVDYCRTSDKHHGRERNGPEPILDQLASAQNHDEVAQIIEHGFQATLRRTLRLPADGEPLPRWTQLPELGVNSLVAVDVRHWFMKELHVDVSVLELLAGGSIEDVVKSAAEKLDAKLTPGLDVTEAQTPNGSKD